MALLVVAFMRRLEGSNEQYLFLGESSVRVCVCACVHYVGAAFGACKDTVYDAMAIYTATACLFLFLWKSVDQGCVHMMPVAGWRECVPMSDVHEDLHFSTPQRLLSDGAWNSALEATAWDASILSFRTSSN